MAENLNYKAPKSICYEETQANCDKYGRLYNQKEALNVCPKGWHLPNESEWCVLVDCGDGQYHSGKKLKAITGWDRDGNGTDDYGFAALPGGSAYFNKGMLSGDFNYSSLGTIGYWWIATEKDYDYSVVLLGSRGDETVADQTSPSEPIFFSIRCIKGFGDYSDNDKPKVFSFKDGRDGKTYKYVIIGTQTWMAENLNYETVESKCYGNEPANCEKYGRLYNWEEAVSLCPNGWHLPSDKEFGILDDYVGEYGGNIAEKLRATVGWHNDEGNDENGTDDYGFAALPGGYGDYENSSYIFRGVNQSIVLWSSDEVNADNAYGQYIWDIWITSLIGGEDKRSLFSVRCIMN